MVHKTTGKRMGQFFQDEVAKPLGIDFWIGTPEALEPRIAPVIPMMPDPALPPSRLVAAALADRESPPALFLFNGGGFNPNSREGHAAEIGAGNGISNGRGLAGLYAPLANGGSLNGRRYVGAETLTRMSQVSVATHEDATLMIPTRFSLGYMKSMDNRKLENSENCSAIMSAAAFGHVGAGGSIGFADPECRMSFGYSMNKMGLGILLNDRGQSLVDAAYRSAGYRTNAGGVWTH
jgi:CubicO group peptidase (beta-lactamase class C family)